MDFYYVILLYKDKLKKGLVLVNYNLKLLYFINIFNDRKSMYNCNILMFDVDGKFLNLPHNPLVLQEN